MEDQFLLTKEMVAGVPNTN